MSEIAIRAVGLGKRYRLGERLRYKSLRESIMTKITAPRRGGRQPADTIWALRNVSFTIASGEVVGVIGRNGAGKSTLLKILARITEPTEGRAEIYGRVGSLLEIGTGFHPELTGRENIYLNGAILGMRRAEISKKFDEIVAFAEVERFIDTPVKHYSSGMYLRLAFAVAAHLQPDVLLIDEVLAVGDALFQKKCLGKMGDVASEGRTVLFVSHDLGAVHRLTRSCLFLKGGTIAQFGHTGNVVTTYLSEASQSGTDQRRLEEYRRQGSGGHVRFVRLWTDHDREGGMPSASAGDDFRISLAVEADVHVAGANLTCAIKNAVGQRVVVLFSWDQGFMVDLAPGEQTLHITVRGLPLAPGRYYADFGLNQAVETVALDVLLDVPLMEISMPPDTTQWLNRPWGVLHWNQVEWHSSRA